MLNGPQRKFVEGIVSGLTGEAAYAIAYPKSKKTTARANAARLLTNADVAAEIQLLRDKADQAAGSAVLTLAEKRKFLARIVRLEGANIDERADADLINGLKYDKFGNRVLDVPDKLRAIELDAKLAGELAQDKAADKQAEATNAIAQAINTISNIAHGRD